MDGGYISDFHEFIYGEDLYSFNFCPIYLLLVYQ